MKYRCKYFVSGLFLGLMVVLALTAPAWAAVFFAPAANYPVGTDPWGAVSGDFNGDGKLDLAVANRGTSNVSVLLNVGDGTFNAAVNYLVGSNPRAIAVGDFNQDGKLDLAVANSASNTISLLLGVGDGTFTNGTPVGGLSGPFAVITADFDHDNILDLAVANSGSNNVSIFLGSAVTPGTFTLKGTFPVGINPVSLAAAFFDAGGHLDLAVTNGGSGTVSILLGDGTGSFSAAVAPIVGTSPNSVITGDFNIDGKVDLAVANNASNNVSILLGNNDGTFLGAVNYNVGISPFTITSGDFSTDGKIDLATANNSGGNVSVLNGVGDGTFTAGGTFAAGTGPHSVITADFNGDGKLDLAVTNGVSNTVSILINGSSINISVAPTSKNFGDVLIGNTSTAQTFTISNTGTTDLIIGAITKSGANPADFEILNDLASGQTIIPGGNRTVQADFKPTAAGLMSAALNIPSNSPSSPLTVSLSGTGVTPQPNISLNPTDGNFGTFATIPPVPVPVKNYTVTNSGTANLIIGLLNITGANAAEFAIQNDLASNATLLPAENKTFQLTFNPATDGTKTAVLHIPSNDPDTGDFTINLSGAVGTISISGKITKGLKGLKEIPLNLASGGFTTTTSTLADGTYLFQHLPDGNYTITPSNPLYKFDPLSITAAIGPDSPNNNFTAKARPRFGISGKVKSSTGTPISWLTLALTDGTFTFTSITNVSGDFAFFVPNGDYTLTPFKCGFDFKPTELALTVSNFNWTGLLFTLDGTFPNILHGKVKDTAGKGFKNVTMTLSGDCNQTVVTTKKGKYFFRAIDGDYTITPDNGVDTFDPAFTDVNITGTVITPPLPLNFQQQ